MTVILQSSRFGELQIPDEAVIDFPSGLIGLGGRAIALLARSEESRSSGCTPWTITTSPSR